MYYNLCETETDHDFPYISVKRKTKIISTVFANE